MNESFPKIQNEGREGLGEIEGVRISLEAAKQLKVFFEGVYPEIHRPSGKELLTISFGIGRDATDREKVVILLELLDILPWENESRNTLTIDSKWDIEKLVLMGVIERNPNAGEQEHKDYDLDPHVFGSFPVSPTSKDQRKSSKTPRIDESAPISIEGEITGSVDEYIRNDGFYDEYFTELLLKQTPDLYTSIDTQKGFSFLRNHSHYAWRTDEEGVKRLFRKKDGQEISQEERQKVLALAKEGNKDAMNQAVEMNIGLVYFVLNNMLYHGFRVRSLEDTLQEGMLALHRAIELYDSNIGTFSSYAVPCIEGTMRTFASGDDLVHIPVNTQWLRSKIRRIAELQMQKDSEDPNIRDIADALDLVPDVVAKQLHESLHHQKLKQIESYIEILTDNGAQSPEEYVEQGELRRLTREVIGDLTPREKEVLRRFFGIKDGDQYDHDQTLEIVGKDFDVTPERIRQIKEKALRKLRHPSYSDVLRDLIDYNGVAGLVNPKIHPNDNNTTTSALHDRGEIEE